MAPVPLQPRPTPRSVDLPVVRALRGAGSGTGRLVLPADAAVLVLPEWPDLGAPHVLPLLALWLAREGRPVLVHRPAGEDPAAATGLVLHNLGIAEAQDAEDVADRWARREPALVSSALLTTPGRCPGAWRLAVPAGPRVALPLVACGSAGDRDSAAFVAGLSGQAWLCLLQAAEGPRGSPLAPSLAAYLGTAPMAGPALGLPADPMERWGATTRGGGPAAAALFAQDVLSGARPLPEPLRRLAAGVVGHLESLAETHSREP
jgi:hypothetical protein